jgi:hypothetical protein
MSAETAAAQVTFTMGRFCVTMTAQRPVLGGTSHVVCEWDPHLPKRLSASERREYRRKSREFCLVLPLPAGCFIWDLEASC